MRSNFITNRVTQIKPDVRSLTYLIVQAQHPCPSCEKTTDVFAIYLPPRHETLEPTTDNGRVSHKWHSHKLSASISLIEGLSAGVVDSIHELTSNFFKSHHHTNNRMYWQNHCEHCKQAIADEILHDHRQGLFRFPVTEDDQTTIYTVSGRLEAKSDWISFGQIHLKPLVFTSDDELLDFETF